MKDRGRDWVKYSGLGVQMVGTIVVFTLLGRWLDGYFGTEPLLTIVLILVGLAGGIYVALRDFI